MKKELLMKRYKSGEIGPEEQQLLESYIEQGIIKLEELEDLDMIHKAANPIPENIPSQQMKERFNLLVSEEKAKASHISLWDRLWNLLAIDLPVGQYYRLAYTAGILIIGLIAGWLISPANKYQNELSSINSEVHQMKEMMMLSMLKKTSVTERLKAVSMSSELPSSYGRVVEALFHTLNNDENVNVRLAALEALAGYAEDPIVRENLIESISMQESPLVQIQLADLMVEMQERKSVDELKKIMEKENTDPGVKQLLRKSIGQLI
jgi:hypothetical protein